MVEFDCASGVHVFGLVSMRRNCLLSATSALSTVYRSGHWTGRNPGRSRHHQKSVLAVAAARQHSREGIRDRAGQRRAPSTAGLIRELSKNVTVYSPGSES